ncbi:MAG: hypothetical protein JWL65_1537 [Gammaproteobacteria bacterium]|nr:hypothetical protein [Gammaproteobacteria bacterium]
MFGGRPDLAASLARGACIVVLERPEARRSVGSAHHKQRPDSLHLDGGRTKETKSRPRGGSTGLVSE